MLTSNLQDREPAKMSKVDYTYFNLKRLNVLCLLIFLTATVGAQSPDAASLSGRWTVTGVVNLNMQLGVAKPASTNLKHIRTTCLNKVLVISSSKLYLPQQLKELDSFSDSVFLSKVYRARVIKDTEQSFRYPGDELLNCTPLEKANEKCYVGETFMKILGSKRKMLDIMDGKGLSPENFEYKVCKVSKHRIGLYLVNSGLIIMLAKS